MADMRMTREQFEQIVDCDPLAHACMHFVRRGDAAT